MQITENITPKTCTSLTAPAAVSIVARIAASVSEFLRRRKNRRKIEAMANLSPHLLDDIGLTCWDIDDALSAGQGMDPVTLLKVRRKANIAEMARLTHCRLC